MRDTCELQSYGVRSVPGGEIELFPVFPKDRDDDGGGI